MFGVAAKPDFLPLAEDIPDDLGEFELLFKAQDTEIFALIEPSRDSPTNDDHGLTGDELADAGQEKTCGAPAEIGARTAEVTALKDKLSEYENEIAALRLTDDARHAMIVEHELSIVRHAMAEIRDGMTTAVTDAICSEVARVLEPFLAQSVVNLSIAELEATITKMVDGRSDKLFLISGSKEALTKFSPLFEANNFQFKFILVDSNEVTVEYDNHLLSTRFDHWARFLRPELVE